MSCLILSHKRYLVFFIKLLNAGGDLGLVDVLLLAEHAHLPLDQPVLLHQFLHSAALDVVQLQFIPDFLHLRRFGRIAERSDLLPALLSPSVPVVLQTRLGLFVIQEEVGFLGRHNVDGVSLHLYRPSGFSGEAASHRPLFGGLGVRLCQV